MRISIHVLRVEDDILRTRYTIYGGISIHVLRVEDDSPKLGMAAPAHHFNPRPPCGGRHFDGQPGIDKITISIHVLRVEDDRAHGAGNHAHTDFNPRPPCGGRLPPFWYEQARLYFNPRPPCGGRPLAFYLSRFFTAISIHVLRVEDDSQRLHSRADSRYFNPRPPCGGRPIEALTAKLEWLFQSTSSVWRTTLSI